jgi:hypothetical protein
MKIGQGSFDLGGRPVTAIETGETYETKAAAKKECDLARAPVASLALVAFSWLNKSGKHEIASFLGAQPSGDAAMGVGYQILDTDSRIPYPSGFVPGSRGDSSAVRRPRHTFHFSCMGANDNDLSTGLCVPNPHCPVVRPGDQPSSVW